MFCKIQVPGAHTNVCIIQQWQGVKIPAIVLFTFSFLADEMDFQLPITPWVILCNSFQGIFPDALSFHSYYVEVIFVTDFLILKSSQHGFQRLLN